MSLLPHLQFTETMWIQINRATTAIASICSTFVFGQFQVILFVRISTSIWISRTSACSARQKENEVLKDSSYQHSTKVLLSLLSYL